MKTENRKQKIQKPSVSVVIVSYNTRDLTTKSIQSVYNSHGFAKGGIEIIVIDNHSTDGSMTDIKKMFPSAILIENESNIGFGAANNQGVALAKGEYILLLNSDAFLGNSSLRHMVDILDQHPEYLSVGPALHSDDGSIQMSAGYFPSVRRVLAWMWWLDKLPGLKRLYQDAYHIFDPAWYSREQHPDWLMGACILLRKSDFESVGGFDEQIFMYAEEVELYMRLIKNTNKINIFAPQIYVTHIGSASTTKAKAMRLTQELHGLEYIYHKHFPGSRMLLKWILTSGVWLRIAIFSLIPSRKESIHEYWRYIRKC
jgi:GT2 family glycosyltransferase